MTPRSVLAVALASIFLRGHALAETFSTRAQAMDFIAVALPKATSENPKYVTKADGTVSQWLTEQVGFASAGANPVTTTMHERFTQRQGDKTTEGKHRATFSMSEVTVAEFSAPWDVTPSGAPALGLLFTCDKPGCVAAYWGEAPSKADKADLYIQDPAKRAQLLAAFRRLQAP